MFSFSFLFTFAHNGADGAPRSGALSIRASLLTLLLAILIYIYIQQRREYRVR